MLVKRVVFICYVLLLFVFLCCLFPYSRIHLYYFVSVLLFCHKTKWSSCLHLVILLPFFFLLFGFEFCLFFVFIPLKEDPQKTGHSKNPKKQKCRKNGQKKIG